MARAYGGMNEPITIYPLAFAMRTGGWSALALGSLKLA